MYQLEQKLKIIEFSNKFGYEATISAFDVAKSTIYLWKKKLRESHNMKHSLINKSTSRIKRNIRYWDHRINDFIVLQRSLHPRLAKEKIYVLLKVKCLEWGIKLPSITTVGRLIKDNSYRLVNLKPNLSYFANTATFRTKIRPNKKKTRPEKEKITKPGQRLQIDTVIIYIKGVRRFIMSIKDVYSRMTFSYGYTSLSSSTAKDFIQKASEYLGFIDENSVIQNDNGLEFMKHFESYLLEKNIKQVWNYPNHPKMNAFIERYNRTIQEEFANWYTLILKDNIVLFNELLVEWLTWYNYERPHFSLDLKSPYKYLCDYYSFSKMT